MSSLATLPDDPALLKQMLLEREARIAQIKEEAAQRLEALQPKHKAEGDALLRRFYGPRPERFDPRQLLLFGLRVDSLLLDEASIAEQAGEALAPRDIRGRPRNRHAHGRGTLPAPWPRIPIGHDLTEEEKKRPCCGNPRRRIGQEVSAQREYGPASLQVLQHVRYK